MPSTPASSGDPEDLTGERLLLVKKLVMPPVRPDLVARSRLVNQLSLGIQHPLTLIAAPAGFGKTTLLSTWLEQASLRSAWLSLEQDDDDLIRFLSPALRRSTAPSLAAYTSNACTRTPR